MKKNVTIIISIICLIIITTVFATTANSSEFYYENEDTTVIFDTDTELSYEQKQMIADKIVYGYSSDDQISTYSWCWLVGHELESHIVTAIEHKVDQYEPRCIKRAYSVDVCTACDYINEELISTTYIFCCPED